MTQIYPQITIDRIKNPSRIYAIPVFGFVLKLIMVIPVEIELSLLNMAQFVFTILNSFNIFFRGRYWKMAHQLNLGIMQLESNVSFFLWGLTDMYPGFSLKTTNYELTIDYNKNPNRLLATPLFGMLFRFIVMIPYLVYRQIVSTAAMLAVLISWAPVLSKGRYPETTYEIARDSIRVDQAVSAYFLGISDTYPSWWISMNHKAFKIALLVAAAILTLLSFTNNTGWNNWNKANQKQLQNNRTLNTVQKAPSSYTY